MAVISTMNNAQWFGLGCAFGMTVISIAAIYIFKYILTRKNFIKKEEITCCVCDGPCEMNTEYEGSAICMDKKCSVHNEE